MVELRRVRQALPDEGRFGFAQGQVPQDPENHRRQCFQTVLRRQVGQVAEKARQEVRGNFGMINKLY